MAEDPTPHQKRVAAIVTEYRHNSHADVIVSRLLQTDTLDGKGRESPLELVSLYTDQRPANDISRLLAASHRFRVSDTIEDALTLGTGKLAVDGVLLVAEHGQYPKSATGNTQYPKRRFWEETIRIFRASGRVVPVFVDKHLADNWDDAKRIYDTARELKVPLMAGSSLPGSWRKPAVDVARGAKLAEIVSITYGSSDAYAFHAMEFTQALAEQRHGGETGVKAVRALSGNAVWQAAEEKVFDPPLFDAAWQHIPNPRTGGKPLRDVVPEPKLFSLEYNDGLKAHLLELNGAVSAFARRVALCRRRPDRIVRILDARRASRRAFRSVTQRHRADDAHRSSVVERRTYVAHLGRARCAPGIVHRGGAADRDTIPRRRVPADLVPAGTAAAAPDAPLGRSIARPKRFSPGRDRLVAAGTVRLSACNACAVCIAATRTCPASLVICHHYEVPPADLRPMFSEGTSHGSPLVGEHRLCRMSRLASPRTIRLVPALGGPND